MNPFYQPNLDEYGYYGESYMILLLGWFDDKESTQNAPAFRLLP